MAATRALRRVLSELRLSVEDPKSIKNARVTQYIMQQYRKHQTTERQHCKAAAEMTHLADSYATYLASQRKWKEVHEEYHAKGERSVEDTAKIVGFKLPHDPK